MKNKFSIALSLAVIMAMLVTSLALASDVNVAVVDVTVPTNGVTLAPGGSASITINMTVSGAQAGTATFEVYRDWTLSGGTFTGSNPQEFTVGPRVGGDPATTLSTSGTVTIAAGQDAGAFTLAVGVFDISNSNATGAKLAAGDPSNYQVTVSAPPPPSDTTAPIANPFISSTEGSSGWYTSDVTVAWNWSDNPGGSGIDSSKCTLSSTSSGEGSLTLSAECYDLAGNKGASSVAVNVDKTAPTISGSSFPGANANGWNNTAVTVSFTCGDVTSGILSCSTPLTISDEGTNHTAVGSAIDNAGNSASAVVSDINVDKTAPSVFLVDGPASGANYYFGSVPAAPTCSASDSLSGLDGSCSISGYSTAVGTHTVSASVTDRAGNLASVSVTYNVLAWTLGGFYQPADMGTNIWNTVKGGSTVPLKFEVFAGTTELTATSVVKSFVPTKVACDGSASFDDIELTTSGGTSLRYDATAGQFIQNWQTPKQPGICYKVTMTTQDNSSLVAFFKLK